MRDGNERLANLLLIGLVGSTVGIILSVVSLAAVVGVIWAFIATSEIEWGWVAIALGCWALAWGLWFLMAPLRSRVGYE